MVDFPVIEQGGQEVPWVELRLESHIANTPEDVDANIEYALTRKVTGFQEILNTESGAVSVVGSGPSLKENWQRIAQTGADIIACNASCQFLLEREIVPKYMFCFDADPLMVEFITPHPDITYLIASRCPPPVWELLEGCRVVQWHAAGDMHIQQILEQHQRQEAMVAGGSAAVTRAMVLAPPLGYRSVHLWGADSSFVNGHTHIRASTTKERQFQIMVNNRAFYCAPWMAQQLEDFKVLAPTLRDEYGVSITVHGYGALPHLAKAMHFDVDGEARIEQLWREISRKARFLWSQL